MFYYYYFLFIFVFLFFQDLKAQKEMLVLRYVLSDFQSVLYELT